MPTQAIIKIENLGSPWKTLDPFLVCAHHEDAYPNGNTEFGPALSLRDRDLGRDFSGKNGWNMYFGQTVPGFPAHPHRGFETVTIVRKGFVDHSDSLGASARFGAGDVQWITAGRGIVHAEMFPLLNSNKPNPMELLQIWLNLPARTKMTAPHFRMLWSEDIPLHVSTDDQGGVTEVACIAGELPGAPRPLPAPPDSLASDPTADLAIWTIKMSPGSRWVFPAASSANAKRMLYFFKGASLSIDGEVVDHHSAIEMDGTKAVELVNGFETTELLMLQGRPIGEPVVQHGPFVMNSKEELQQAYSDYHLTNFGEWSWADNAPVHGPHLKRFARHADGYLEDR